MRHLRRFLATLFLPVLLVVAATATSPADDLWQPLALSTHWRYVSDLGGGEDVTMVRTTVFFGRPVIQKHFTGGVDDDLDQFWLTDADGSVLLAGWNRHLESVGVAYDPPLTILKAPPALGASWTDHTTSCDLPDLTVLSSFSITWTVYEEDDLAVPYGTVHAFGVGQSVSGNGLVIAPHAGFGLDGRRIEGASSVTHDSNTSDWFAANVGLVQYHTDTFHRLADFDHPVLAAPPSWGRVKRLYR